LTLVGTRKAQKKANILFVVNFMTNLQYKERLRFHGGHLPQTSAMHDYLDTNLTTKAMDAIGGPPECSWSSGTARIKLFMASFFSFSAPEIVLQFVSKSMLSSSFLRSPVWLPFPHALISMEHGAPSN